MKILGNLIWLLFGGLIASLGWALAGLLCCITIVGVPFGLQCFKIATLVLWPFGKDISVGEFGVGGALFNIIWILCLGWELCVTHFVTGLLLCLTIVGIPFGKQHFKLAALAILPFGAKID